MNYRESEREKVVRIRNNFFHDPGNGYHLGVSYPFILTEPDKNLWSKIRKEAVNYFKQNNIVWWPLSKYCHGNIHKLNSQGSVLLLK